MMKLFIALFSLLLLTCQPQTNYPTDWALAGLKKQPKKMSSTMEFENPDNKLKEIYYYSKDGYITKIEHYNNYFPKEDSLALGQISFIGPPINSKRRETRIEAEKGDTAFVIDYNMINANTLTLESTDYFSPYQTVVQTTIDDQALIQERTTKVLHLESGELFLHTTNRYRYDKDDLVEIEMIDHTKKDAIEVSTVGRKELDKKGNITYIKYLNEAGKVVYKEEKVYEYY